MGLPSALDSESGETDVQAVAQLRLASAVPAPDTSMTSGVAVSRSRSRESAREIDDSAEAAVTPAPVATAVPAPAPPAAPTPTTAAPKVATGAFAAAAARIGLRGYARDVYSAVRTTFGITNIGGYRAGDPRDHGTGHAVDVMITSRGQGDEVAAFVMAHASEFHVKYIIWRQRIWFPGGSWKAMADRGGITANHYDHVHVSVLG
jgi:hypothetical protein